MSTLKELRDVRIQKLNKLREMGVDPYPSKSYKNTANAKVVSDFETLENQEVIVAGRAIAIRNHGKLSFIDIKDETGRIQLYIKEQNLTGANYKYSELNYEDLHLLDTGDFVEGKGKVVKTPRGAISVEVTSLRLLVKTLRPMPDQWDGLKDKETRLRKRYLDTNMNEEVYNRFLRRAKFWEVHREFLKQNGFYEMNIPVLEMIPGGADATPFITHMNAIDQDFYLRISQELYLKRLVGAGYPRVYEVGPRFRNEGLSDEHLPEHMAMEFYWAYADYKQGMKLIQDLFKAIVDKVYDGKTTFEIRGHKVDFSKDWEVIDFAEIMQKQFGVDVHNPNLKTVEDQLRKNKVHIDFDMNAQRGVDNLWKVARKTISGPAFLINHPKYMSPLSKSMVDFPHITERFQPIIAGSELGNGWSELNDPLDQFERFKEQQAMRDAGDAEAQMLDVDYVEMLEYGMPLFFTDRAFTIKVPRNRSWKKFFCGLAHRNARLSSL
jgi:lysyl-tRNA synthetase class 2